jgi:DNA mismatch repair ATPase MutS
MEARIKKEKEQGVVDQVKAVQREVAQIFTKGTHFKLDFESKTSLGDYDTKYVLSFYQNCLNFGFCYFDMSTLKFYIGQFEDDFTLKQFRTLVM